jgi:hypothetical protein
VWLNYQFVANELLKLLALHQLFGANIEHKRTIWRAKQTVNFVDANVAISGGFTDGQSDLLGNRNRFGVSVKSTGA